MVMSNELEWHIENGSVIFERPTTQETIVPGVFIGPSKSFIKYGPIYDPFEMSNGCDYELEESTFLFSLPVGQADYIQTLDIDEPNIVYAYMMYYKMEVLDFVTLYFATDDIIDFNIWGNQFTWEHYIDSMEKIYSHTNMTRGFDPNFDSWTIRCKIRGDVLYW